MRLAAVLLAAGNGVRFGSVEPKQFLQLGDRTVLEHAVDTFGSVDGIDELWVVTAPQHVERVRALCGARTTGVLVGGDTRQGSTRAALDHLDEAVTHVLIHDAARPLVTARTIRDCVEALRTADAVGTVVPVDDTIVVVAGDRVVDVPDRATLRAQQTPQGFRRSVLASAQASAGGGLEATDDLGVVVRELPDTPLAWVAGDRRAMKLTRPEDLVVLRALLDSGPAQS